MRDSIAALEVSINDDPERWHPMFKENTSACDRALIENAESTLGWQIGDPSRFLSNCSMRCLGDALNLEHDYLD